MSTTWPCCDHCVDDQPHIEPDTHEVPCETNGCQVTACPHCGQALP